jgi:Flp pilus assembly protein TadD
MPESELDQLLDTGYRHQIAGRLGEAESAYRQILARQPNHPGAMHLLGYLAHQVGRDDAALELINQAIAGNPKECVYLNTLGAVLAEMGRTEEAIDAFRRVLAIQPNLAEVYNNLGNALQTIGRLDEATAAYRQALALPPDATRQSIQRDAATAEAHFNVGCLLLLQGEFEVGWKEFEWRCQMNCRPMEFPQPRWDGGPLGGKRILLHSEQGLGDAIQFVRYASMVAERGGRVIAGCRPELARLFRGVAGVEQVVSVGDPLPAFDVHSPMMSLPLAFNTRLDSIPANIPYLKPDPDLVAAWRQRLEGDQAQLRIGMVWAGSPAHRNDRFRSMSLAMFEPLTKLPGVGLYSLQKGATAAAQVTNSKLNIADFTAELADFADTAAFIQSLDLVVSVDTAVAHLAGALGKPVWLLLPLFPDYRWMLNREDTPWYPSARLFRQVRQGNWGNVIELVSKALTELRNV